MTETDEGELTPWEPFPRDSSERIYDSPWVGLRRDMVRLDDGRLQELHVVEISPAVVVVPVLEDGRIVMLWQFRHSHGRTHWEVPAGRLDAGETPAQAATRELREEAGVAPGTLERLGGFYPSNGISAHWADAYVARDCRVVGEPTLDPAERIRCVARDAEEVRAELERGDYEDGFTALALFYAFCRL